MKELKILNFPWHIAHQAELMKIPDTKWHWLVQHRRNYSEMPRGDLISKHNIEWVSQYEPGKYDLAILHLDQQCFEQEIELRGKGSLYREINSVIQDIPKIVIMHGTPYYPEKFDNDITNDTFAKNGISSDLIYKFKQALGNSYAVTNSKVAFKQWDLDEKKHKAFWHGLDKDEWWDLPKEPRVVTMIGPAGLDKYYDRNFLRAVKETLQDRDIHHCHITVDATFKNWDEYRNFLGRSLIYFNPTRESPMPRSRTEAMFSGCCVITTASHDADQFIEDNENGLLLTKRQPVVVADLIEMLITDYNKAIEIGQRGKEMAHKVFSGDRYRKEWREYMDWVIEDFNKNKKK